MKFRPSTMSATVVALLYLIHRLHLMIMSSTSSSLTWRNASEVMGKQTAILKGSETARNTDNVACRMVPPNCAQGHSQQKAQEWFDDTISRSACSASNTAMNSSITAHVLDMANVLATLSISAHKSQLSTRSAKSTPRKSCRKPAKKPRAVVVRRERDWTQRRRRLEADPWTANVRSKSVFCNGCFHEIR